MSAHPSTSAGLLCVDVLEAGPAGRGLSLFSVGRRRRRHLSTGAQSSAWRVVERSDLC